ncbi:terpenoid synthase [Lasiosphaeris hirsuta]|uniref:Terpene synthase n=1 Tax=Lasiosphaeris hirsuta TaxID=260670 RepID=A0AA40AHP8_9PEZI|nr:terpenoid synthase [Lasiosphaeris hirsuta]
MAAVKIKLPDFLDYWPWQREINPYYEEVKAEANAWAHSFGFFDKKSQDAFDRCDFSKLAMLTYPYMNKAQARSACDLMVLFYVFDEYTDIKDEHGARKIADMVMDALRNPSKPRPAGELQIAELARQYWARASAIASPMTRKHFIDTFQQFTDAVVEQAADRESDRVRTIAEFWALRDHTGGCLPSFNLIEFDLDFPDELYNHGQLEQLREIANRSVAACNDIYSYNIERARGHALHNIVTVAMYEKDIDVGEVMVYLNDWHNSILADFLRIRDEVQVMARREYGDAVAKQVAFYVDGLARWIRGSDDWHFEGQRHFGEMGPQIRLAKEILVLPRVDATDARTGLPVGIGGDGDMIREMLETTKVAGFQISVPTHPTVRTRGWSTVLRSWRRLGSWLRALHV